LKSGDGCGDVILRHEMMDRAKERLKPSGGDAYIARLEHLMDDVAPYNMAVDDTAVTTSGTDSQLSGRDLWLQRLTHLCEG
jgi:hypothetical protein